ncbi:MAG: PLD nuclease N-terminal domain-containing protein [Actinomycetia bacterium]|nr:PLD nuclease N-terminal domain-containing protein [Actinomycetes bacterium]
MFQDIEITADILVVIAIVVPLFLLWVAAFIDLFRRKDLGIGKKLMWGAIVIFSAHVGLLLYFVFRPVPPPSGKRLRDKNDRASGIVTAIEDLHDDHDAGDITDTAYLTAKRTLLGLGT